MKVAIDSSALSSGHKVRGVGKYTKSLIESLQELAKKKKDFHLEAVDFDLVGQEKLSEYDVIHYPYFDLFNNTLPGHKVTNTVITVHDVIPLLYPQHYPPGIRGRLKLFQQKQALQSTKAVITDSQTSKKDIIRFLGYSTKKIYPIYLAPSFNYKKPSESVAEKIRRKYKLPTKFVLYVGDINYNKNLITLAKACTQAQVPLVIVGKQAAGLETQMNKADLAGGVQDSIRYLMGKTHPELVHYKELKRLFDKHKKTIFRIGYLEDEEFCAVWQMASVYCQPSLYEGFGLPVLEAFSAGVPVIASRTQALVEIAEDTALFVDPLDIDAWVKQIKKVTEDKNTAKKLIQLGKDKLRNYSWTKTAQMTYEVYRKAYKER